MTAPGMIAMLHGAPLGTGGLGLQSFNAVHDILSAGGIDRVVAMGPGQHDGRPGPALPPSVETLSAPSFAPLLPHRYSWLRWRQGRRQYLEDVTRGRWASARLALLLPAAVYGFTQVSLESLEWARRAGVPERWRLVFALNPMVGVIEGFRFSLLGQASANWDTMLAMSVAMTIFLLVLGRWAFRSVERDAADWL